MATPIINYYTFYISDSGRTKGVIEKAVLKDGITARTYTCNYSYTVADTVYRAEEVVSVDSATNFYSLDTVTVLYSAKEPVKSTIDSKSNHQIRLLFAVFLLIWLVCSVVTLVFWLVKYVFKKGK